MKQLLITIAAVVLVGCGESQQSATAPEAKPESATVKVPDISIHEAAEDGNIEAVKQHLAAGTDVNAENIREQTPLHSAIRVGNTEIAALLIANGADVNAIHIRSTPLDWAITRRHPETVDLLRKHGGKTDDWFKADESIHIAASVGHIEAVQQHLGLATDVNAKKWSGETPLHYAAQFGHKEIVELLIAKGADLNAKDNLSMTPLDSAKRHREIADLLRKHGAKTGEELKAEGK